MRPADMTPKVITMRTRKNNFIVLLLLHSLTALQVLCQEDA
jgi:hypothetical protein